MRIILLSAAALALSGCATTPVAAPNYVALIGLAQTDLHEVEAVATAYCAAPAADTTACAKITAARAVADPLVAALTATTAPTTITAAFADINAIMTAPLPSSLVKTQTQVDLAEALAIMQAVAPIAAQIAPLL